MFLLRRKSNIFDNMMVLMEKYAYNLEELVQQRTNQLSEEKKKTENLLLRMLPRYTYFHMLTTVSNENDAFWLGLSLNHWFMASESLLSALIVSRLCSLTWLDSPKFARRVRRLKLWRCWTICIHWWTQSYRTLIATKSRRLETLTWWVNAIDNFNLFIIRTQRFTGEFFLVISSLRLWVVCQSEIQTTPVK